MSRTNESIFKRSRRLSFSILESDKEFLKGKQRTTPPGEHKRRKLKMSNYALQLQAKQRIRFLYGIGEKHLKNAFLSARNKKGNVGHLFLISLELRLDNVIFRGGLTQTRRQARQFVSHGHISVNGSKVDIPSYKVRLGDVITLNNKLQSNEMVLSSVSNNGSAP